jgi:hypothetical protein
MNAHDKSNLDFVISLDDDEFDQWAEHASNDDLLYALELISTAKAELELERLEVLDMQLGSTGAAKWLEDEANKVLAKFLK